MAGVRKENRRSLHRRLRNVVSAGQYTLAEISRDCGIPLAELETYLNGKGYLFQREIDKLRGCMPRYEVSGR